MTAAALTMLGLGDASNAYAYAFNRPVGLSAPDGRHVAPAGALWGASAASVRLQAPDLPGVGFGTCGAGVPLPSPRPGPGSWEWAEPAGGF